MLFNSYIFVFVFFPICLIGYYGVLKSGKPEKARVFLTVMSLWFYGYFNLSYLLIMICSIAGNYLFHRLLSGESLRLRCDGKKKGGYDSGGGAESGRTVLFQIF